MSALAQLAGRRILFLNWRDRSNPSAGGAETYTEQIAQRFAHTGAQLTLFTSEYRDALPYDWANSYLVVRHGGRFGVYLAAARHLRRYGRLYDAVVDFQNGIPFFAPLWAPADLPVLCVVHHVHQAQFGMYFRWPVSSIGRLLEGRISRRVYRGRPLVAVSPSTRAEMRNQLGFRRPIHIIPNGVDSLPLGRVPRSPVPFIAVVTRLVPHKQLDHLVAAVPELLGRWPDLRVVIAGTGPAQEALQAQVHRLGLGSAVSLPGRVSDQVRSDLLGQAWLTVAPSLGEGWGLTVLEANLMGTPAVAYDVPGLRDSVRDQVTGWLVPSGFGLSTALGKAMDELTDADRQRIMADRCRVWAGRFSWDASAERLASLLVSESARKAQGDPSRRKTIHLATLAWWSTSDAEEVSGLVRKTLRVTDIITSENNTVTALLIGCDEFGASTALQRVPVRATGLRLATTTEILCGTGAGGLLD
jgi:glycosyltransferase involved in cell wall biosynthesis